MSKRVISMLLSILMMLQLFSSNIVFAKESDPLSYTISIISNTSNITSADLWEQNGTYYMSIQDIAALTRFELTEKKSDTAFSTPVYILKQGAREVVIEKSTGKMVNRIVGAEFGFTAIADMFKAWYQFTNDPSLIESVAEIEAMKEEIFTLPEAKIPFLEMESTQQYECVKMLTYLGASCSIHSEKRLCVLMPQVTIWEAIMPDYSKFGLDAPEAKESDTDRSILMFLDISSEYMSNLPGTIANKVTDTIKGEDSRIVDALYDVLKVSPMNTDAVSELMATNNQELFDFVNSEGFQLLLQDGAANEAEQLIMTQAYISQMLPYIPSQGSEEWQSLYDNDSADDVDQLDFFNDFFETVNDYADSATDFEPPNEKDVFLFALGTANTVQERLSIEEGARTVFSDALDDYDKLFPGKELTWRKSAELVSNDMSSNKNIVFNTIFKEGEDWAMEQLVENGVPALISAFSTASSLQARVLLFGQKLSSIILADSYEGFHADLNAHYLNDIQLDEISMIQDIIIKACKDEKCSNPETLSAMANMLMLYYRTTMAYCENEIRSIEEFSSRKRIESATKHYSSVEEYAAAYMYMLSITTIVPIVDYADLEDTLITDEWIGADISDGTDSIERYREILDMYYHNIANGWLGYEDNLNYDENDVSFLWYKHESNRSLFETGFQLIDINQDGIDELIIGTIDEFQTRIFDIYSIYNDKIIHTAVSGRYDRPSLILYEGNDIFQYYFSGVTFWFEEYYHLENGECIPYEAYMYDEDRNSEEPYFYADSKTQFEYNGYEFYDYDWKHITKDEYELGKAAHKERELDFTLFSEYTPMKNSTVQSNNDHSSSLDSIPQIYLNNESSWLHDPNNPFAIFWFQDLDFDGINEMIYGFEVNAFSGSVYGIYEGKVSGNQFGIQGARAATALDMCYDKINNVYYYINNDDSGWGDGYEHYTINKYQNLFKEGIVGYILSESYDTQTYYGLKDSDSIYNSASISEAEYVRIYNEFVENLQYVNYSTEIIKVSDYINASNDEKLALLTKSYNAFQIGDFGDDVPKIKSAG